MNEEFITWEDFARYVSLFPYRFPINKDVLRASTSKGKDVEKIGKIVEPYIVSILKKYDAPETYYNQIASYLIIDFDEQGNAFIGIDPIIFLTSYLYQITSKKVYDSLVAKKIYQIYSGFNFSKSEEELEEIRKSLKRCFIDVRNEYNDISSRPNALFLDYANNSINNTNKLKYFSDELLWGIRNIKNIMEEFRKPIPQDLLEKVSMYINKVKLLEYITYISIGTSGLFREDLDESELELSFADMVNNYQYLYAVLKQINPEFNNNVNFQNEHATKTFYTSEELCRIITSNERLKDCEVTTHSMDEFLGNTFIDYNTSKIAYEDEMERQRLEAEKKQRVEDFRREILLSWELIPETENKAGYGSSRGLVVPRTEEEKAIIEEKKEKVLNDKIFVFEGSAYLARLKGVNKFEGYEAFVYPDGKVLLEKFYKNTRNGLEPVYNEALYVMTIDKFQEFSKYTKTELRDIKKTDPDLTTINHTKNFVKRVQAILAGIDYDTLTLDYIDAMIEGLKDERGINK